MQKKKQITQTAHFQCPKCGCGVLEEVMENVTVSTVILQTFPDGDATYGDCSHDGGDVVRYQCMMCGWKVPNVEDLADLHNYLNSPESLCKPVVKAGNVGFVEK